MTCVNLGIVGVGNCASTLVQGLSFHGIEDVRVVSAFDVAPGKVGRDLSEAIWAEPNNALRFCEVEPLGVAVADGHDSRPADVAEVWRRSATEVVVSLLPTGAQRESEAYAQAALDAGCAFVNCMPATLARDATRRGRRGSPTPVCRCSATTSRAPSARRSSRKTAFIRVDALGFGATPIEIDVRMSLEDSPSAAPVILEAARVAKAALDEGRGGVLAESRRLMKAAPAPVV
jgi:myo-inositol-1-phosphate synthase